MTSKNLLPHPMYAREKPVPKVDDMLESSRRILERATSRHIPYATVAMISGGKDSICAYLVAKKLGIFVTHIIHGVTGTGIQETTDFVRSFAARENVIYLEAPAGRAYEEYVLKKGFFGKGVFAHQFSYHILKSHPFRAALYTIRGNTRGKKILLLNGARMEESSRRRENEKLSNPIRAEGSNIWVNIIHDWRRIDRDAFLEQEEAPINPVTTKLCRSGECMCGTMQSAEERGEASFYYPQWGEWLDELEKRVRRKWNWGWGEQRPTDPQPAPTNLSIPLMCVDCATQEDL
jgi:3'-phosphoadenosine 5'-phosphosulfate sulfotransferase (PAPS reductase)/FAD synthetase